MRKGWNSAPSKSFPKEQTLCCPKCKSTNWSMTTGYPAYGTGPYGRGRLGDKGSSTIIRCLDCNYQTRESDE